MNITCPHCESSDGYYRYTRITGLGAFFYNADGSIGDNIHLHDSLDYKEQKTMYCSNCHEKIGYHKE